MEAEPLFFHRQIMRARIKVSAFADIIDCKLQITGLLTRADEDRHAPAHRNAGRLDLGAHAAGADRRSGASGDAQQFHLNLIDYVRCVRACGFLRGSSVYKPSISVMMISRFALTILATKADNVSLSPNLIQFIGDRVILVNDRNDAAPQQLIDRHQRVLNVCGWRSPYGSAKFAHANAMVAISGKASW